MPNMDYIRKFEESEEPEKIEYSMAIQDEAIDQFAIIVSNTVMDLLDKMRKDDKTEITSDNLKWAIKDIAAIMFMQVVYNAEDNGIAVLPQKDTLPTFVKIQDTDDTVNN